MANRVVSNKPLNTRQRVLKRMATQWRLYVFLIIPIIYVFIFSYIPMYGIQIAFKDYNFSKGIWESPWCGFDHFITFFKSHNFIRLIGNTLAISLYDIVAGFFPPIILALCLNEVKNKYFRKTVQTITYAPHFLSTVVVVGILNRVLFREGLVNAFLGIFGVEPINFLGNVSYFRSIYVWSGVWQHVGWASIIYIAALASVNPELYEAAFVDGASKIKRIWYIDIPSLIPTATILMIMSAASVLGVGFEKIFLMQNQLNMRVSDVISTYVYRLGLVHMEFSFSTAVGLFQSIVAVIMLTVVNAICRRVSETSLW